MFWIITSTYVNIGRSYLPNQEHQLPKTAKIFTNFGKIVHFPRESDYLTGSLENESGIYVMNIMCIR